MHVHAVAFAMDAVRVTVWLGLLLLIFPPLERLFAERPRSAEGGKVSGDLAWYFGNGLFTPLALAGLTSVLAVALRWSLPPPTLDLPLWQRMLATLVVGEFGFYWGHRWSHEIPLLWRFHAVHHTPGQVTWLTNSRGHPVDIVFTRLCGFVPVYLLGLAQTNVSTQSIAVSLMLILSTLWGFFIHANLKWRFGWLETVIATPAFHRWHHTADEHRDHNFASTLPIYDRLFGTLYLPKTGIAPRFGVDGAVPQSLIGQLLKPADHRLTSWRGRPQSMAMATQRVTSSSSISP